MLRNAGAPAQGFGREWKGRVKSLESLLVGLSEDALAALVTRDAMVGVTKVLPSKEGAKG